ncbi:leuB, partial [Symbiodinium microadriaticum]
MRRSFRRFHAHRVLCLAGDGVGGELLEATKLVLQATGVNFSFEDMDFGNACARQTGVPINEDHVRAVEEIGCVLKGPIDIHAGSASTQVELRGRRFSSANQALRKLFQLYANVRPAKYLEGTCSKFPGTDVVVVRENTEGMYTGEEVWESPDSVVATRRITRQGATRVATFAFEYARANGRKKVTAAHKANVLRKSDTLFLECCRQIASDFPEIEYTEQLCDSLLTGMVLHPQSWDIILCENLFGDLVSDLAAGLVGGLGLAPSALYGDSGVSIFEPAHGSAPDIAGQDRANPTSMLLSASRMLQHLGEHTASRALEEALAAVIKEGKHTTPDLGGTVGTQQMAAAIANRFATAWLPAESGHCMTLADKPASFKTRVLQLPILPTTAADSFFALDSFGNFYRVDYGNHRLMFCQRQIMCAFTACKDVDPATAPVLPEPFTQLLMVQAVAAWRTALTAERRCSLLQFLIVRPMFWCCVESSSSPKAVHFEDPGVTEEQTHVVGAEEIPSRHSSQISVNAMPVLSDEENLLIQQSRVSDMSETKEVEVVDIPVHTKESLSTADSAGAESQKDTSCTTMGRRSRLLGRAADSRWKLRRDELEMQKELSRTLKSTLYLATWKGTDVVMKCVEVPANYDRTDDPTRKTSKENFDPTSSRPLHASEVDQDLLEELLHEIELLSSLRHPNLVLFIGACLDKDAPVMCVTEYMPGGDLERHFMTMRKKHQTPTWRPQFRQVMDWSLAVARGLSFLHSREEPIVHRDLKPLNLLLTRHGEVKIADLGISKMMAAVVGDVYIMTGGVGSWLYMAPEVVRHQKYNEKVDIYAFALIMFFMSSGRHPFHEISKDPEVVLREFAKGKEP